MTGILLIAIISCFQVESHRVAASDLVVPTVDTVRHEMLLSAWLAEHKPLVLCGPPGSGKVCEEKLMLQEMKICLHENSRE